MGSKEKIEKHRQTTDELKRNNWKTQINSKLVQKNQLKKTNKLKETIEKH